MARKSAARRVTGELADLTGRSDEELRLVLTVAAAGGLPTFSHSHSTLVRTAKTKMTAISAVHTRLSISE